MAYTQADIDALDAEIAAIRTATLTRSGDQETRFRPLRELLELRSVMTAALKTAAGQTRTRLAATSKGL